MYRVDVESSFEQMWRYNTIVMCGGYAAAPSSEQLYVVSAKDHISDGALECEPDGFELPRRLSLSGEAADHIRVIIYVVPHTLPLGREVENFPPFDIDVAVYNDDNEIYNMTHKVNQWGGAAIEIKLN